MIVENRVAGTRITVWDVLHHLENGWPVKEIAEILGLSDGQVQEAADYIHAHQAEVMKVRQQIEQRNSRGNPPDVQAKLVAARARRIQWLEQRRQTIAG